MVTSAITADEQEQQGDRHRRQAQPPLAQQRLQQQKSTSGASAGGMASARIAGRRLPAQRARVERPRLALPAPAQIEEQDHVALAERARWRSRPARGPRRDLDAQLLAQLADQRAPRAARPPRPCRREIPTGPPSPARARAAGAAPGRSSSASAAATTVIVGIFSNSGVSWKGFVNGMPAISARSMPRMRAMARLKTSSETSAPPPWSNMA